jgi:pimeloyl-ACP methyl ester carboxylesterase
MGKSARNMLDAMKNSLLALLVCATAAAGCSVAGEPAQREAARATAPATATGTVAWSPCTDLTGADGKPTAPDPAVECGKVTVPLDYAKPDGDTIDLALIRLKATGDRLGSLVFNFGGPGASGVDTLALARPAFAGLNPGYDLVSFDPRGVERSSGVTCGGRLDEFLAAADPKQGDRLAKEFADGCEQDSGKVLPHVGTVNAAQDLDRIRAALGDAKLNYFGLSYGTHLGAVYATKFPGKVGRFVLDSAFDPSVTFEERAVIQATGFAEAFDAFAEDCVAQGCDLGKTPDEVQKAVEGLLDDLRTDPVKVGDRELTRGLAQFSIITPLYAKASWPVLEQGAAAALKGDGSTLMALSDSYTGRRPDGSYSTMMTSNQAITCADSAERPKAADTAALNDKIKKIFPVLAIDGTTGAACAHWPAEGTDEAKRIDATGSAPIMVIGGKGDPATPYEWAVSLTEKLKTGVLVTYEGEGHGAYLSGSACIARTVDSYLLKGTLPAEPTTCPAG